MSAFSKWEQYFKSVFEKHEVPFEEAHWGEMEAMLDGNRRRKGWLNSSQSYFLDFAVMGMMFTGLILDFSGDTSQGSTAHEINTTPPISNKEIIASNLEELAINNSQKITISEPGNNNSIDRTNLAEEQTPEMAGSREPEAYNAVAQKKQKNSTTAAASIASDTKTSAIPKLTALGNASEPEKMPVDILKTSVSQSTTDSHVSDGSIINALSIENSESANMLSDTSVNPKDQEFIQKQHQTTKPNQEEIYTEIAHEKLVISGEVRDDLNNSIDLPENPQDSSLTDENEESTNNSKDKGGNSLLEFAKSAENSLEEQTLIKFWDYSAYTGEEKGHTILTQRIYNTLHSIDAGYARSFADQKLGIGLHFNKSVNGKRNRTSIINSMLGLHASLKLGSNANHYLRIGSSLFLNYARYHWARFTFVDMIEQQQGFIYPTAEVRPNESATDFDFNFSTYYVNHGFFVATSVRNLLNHNRSIINPAYRNTPTEWSAVAGYNLSTATAIMVTPFVKYEYETYIHKLSPGVLAGWEKFILGFKYRNLNSPTVMLSSGHFRNWKIELAGGLQNNPFSIPALQLELYPSSRNRTCYLQAGLVYHFGQNAGTRGE